MQTCYFWYFGHVWQLLKMQAKTKIHPPQFSEDTVKIRKLLILDTLEMPGYIHPHR